VAHDRTCRYSFPTAKARRPKFSSTTTPNPPKGVRNQRQFNLRCSDAVYQLGFSYVWRESVNGLAVFAVCLLPSAVGVLCTMHVVRRLSE
jgi:hypothetical protein